MSACEEAERPLAELSLHAQASAAGDERTSDAESDDEAELTGSKLGRHAYWEEAYQTELANFDDHGDEGEVWFGRDVLDTAVRWTGDLLRRMHGARARDLSILDVGCGNGTMLVGLAAQGFANLAGQDYSGHAVELARQVLLRHDLTHVCLREEDLLKCGHGVKRVDVITDKGTLDAIGLSDNPRGREQYRSSVWHLLKPGGVVVITSCNSTREELAAQFCTSGGASDVDAQSHVDGSTEVRWCLVDYVNTYPTFKFGGVEGSKVCTVAFLRLPS